MYVEMTEQGRLFKVKTPSLSKNKNPSVGGIRGEVTEFSRKSRKRMLDMVATIDMPKHVHFVTLTYSDDNLPLDSSQVQKQLERLWSRLRRKCPTSSAIWRIEIQTRKSGRFQGMEVPHIHLLAFNVDYDMKPDDGNPHYSGWFHEAWEAITHHHDFVPDDGAHDLRTEHKIITGNRALMFYTAKYAAKPSSKRDTLVGMPYSHAGRHWGVFNRQYLPIFPPVTVGKNVLPKVYFDLRRAARRKAGKIGSNRRSTGFTLYTDDARKWGDLLYALIECNTVKL